MSFSQFQVISLTMLNTKLLRTFTIHELLHGFLLFRYDGLHHGSSYLEHLNFLFAIQAKCKRAPAVDLQDGLISVAIGVAAQVSIEEGRFVTIEEVMDGNKCKVAI